ncbi:MAG: hypothetical protein ABFD79_14655 [Phycisphaerales bacterium]
MTKDELIKARDEVLQWLESQEESLRYYDEVKDQKSYALVLDKREVNRTLLKALDAQIKAFDVPKIEGLGEAVTNANFTYRKTGRVSCEDLVKLSQAARAYHKITGGDDGYNRN